MKKKNWLIPFLALALVGGAGCSSSEGNGAGGPGGDGGSGAGGGTGGVGGSGGSDGQPAIGVRTKSVITVDGLDFKDSNGNGELDPYEDWRLSADDRAGDLLSRMSDAEKAGLMAHAATPDAPSLGDQDVSDELQSMITAEHIRYGIVTSRSGPVQARALWANNVQELCEGTNLGIPFLLSLDSAHSNGGGRTQVSGFTRFPTELGLGASSVDRARDYGEIVSQEYRAIGVRMALSVPADLNTEPRWHGNQFTFGEDTDGVGDRVSAMIEGLQGSSLGSNGVVAAVGQFPGSGAAKDGWDGRLEKGSYLVYPGDNLDAHLMPFSQAFSSGVAAVMLGYGILETGPWSALGGVIDGTTIEQVGASFSDTVVGDALRDHYGFDGLVIAPPGVIEDAGIDPLGAPWGVEAMTRAERVAAAVNAGVDQFAALNEATPISEARTAGDITAPQVDAAATRILRPMFELGLFENPYVDPDEVGDLVNSADNEIVGYEALYRSLVLLVNEDKPDGFLNGLGDGTQTGDPGNAGNGTGKVLPAPPGQQYVAAGCSYFMMPPTLDDPPTQSGNPDWDFIVANAAGYGELTNFVESITDPRGGASCPLNPADTTEKKIACSNYVFVFIDAPYTADPDSGTLELSEQSLEYAGNDNADALELIATARAAIDTDWSAFGGFEPNTQIVVVVDGGRAAVVDEILAPEYGVSGLFLHWGADTKAFLDTAFGVVRGLGTLPVGLPDSDAAAESQREDVARDGQHPTFIEGFGLALDPFG